MALSDASGGQPSSTRGRHMIAAAAGVSLAQAVLFSVYHTTRRVYYDYYFYPHGSKRSTSSLTAVRACWTQSTSWV